MDVGSMGGGRGQSEQGGRKGGVDRESVRTVPAGGLSEVTGTVVQYSLFLI